MNDFDYLDDCVGEWETLAPSQLTRQQQAVLDVCGTVAFIEGDGLLHVWSESGNVMERVVESFRMVGASELADLLQSTDFCRDIIAKTPPDADDWLCTQEQEDALREAELRFSSGGPDAREGCLTFLPPRKG